VKKNKKLFIQNCTFILTFDRCYSASDHRSSRQPANSFSGGEFTKHGARRKQVYTIQLDHRNIPEFTEKPLNRVVFGFTELRHCKHREFSSSVLAEGNVCVCVEGQRTHLQSFSQQTLGK